MSPEYIPGDEIDLYVDGKLQILPVGHHHATVRAVARHLSKGKAVTVLYLQLPDKLYVVKHVAFYVWHDERMEGYGFLGNDEWPIRFKYTQNMVNRL